MSSRNRYSTAKFCYIISAVSRSIMDVSILERRVCPPAPTDRRSRSLNTPQMSLCYAGIRHPVSTTGQPGSFAVVTLQ